MKSGILGKPGLAGMAVLLLVVIVIPLLISNSYYFDVIIRIAFNAVIAIALNLLIGYTGQISIGHAGFFGIGAYASAIMTSRYGWSPLSAMGLGLVAAGLIAYVMARPILKLKGHYLAMATLGLGLIISIVFNNESLFTGGADGMSVPAFSVAGMVPENEHHWYWMAAVLLVIMTILARRIVDSPLGRALRAIDGSEIAAQVVGINVAAFKVRIFVFSAVVTSLVGSMTAHYVGFITPDIASFFHSTELLIMVVVGGLASVFGSIVGAIIMTLLPQFLSAFEGWETLSLGVMLTATILFLPNGVVPTLRTRWFRKGK